MTEALHQLGLMTYRSLGLAFPTRLYRKRIKRVLRPFVGTAECALRPGPKTRTPITGPLASPPERRPELGPRSGVTRSGRGPGRTLARRSCRGGWPLGTAWTTTNGDESRLPSRPSPLSLALALQGSRPLFPPRPALISRWALKCCSGCRLRIARRWFVSTLFTGRMRTLGCHRREYEFRKREVVMACLPRRHTGGPWMSVAVQVD